MKTIPLLIVLVALVAGTFMNNACKSGHHTWCVPMSSVRHHVQIGSK
jgi:hypothetical protein